MIVIKIIFFPLILLFFFIKNSINHETTSVSRVWYSVCPKKRCRICASDTMNTKNKSTKKFSKKFKITACVFAVIIIGVVAVLLLLPKNKDFLTTFSTNVNEYCFDITVDCEKKELTATQTTKYINNTNSQLKHIKFHVYSNNFSKGAINKPVGSLYESSAYPNGINYGAFTLNNLTLNGEICEYALEGTDKDILCVYFENTLKPNESVSVEMDYSICLPNINHRYGYGNNTINLGNFYPIACVYENGAFIEDHYTTSGDPFYSDMANYTAKITYNNNYTLASSGEQLETTTKENNKTTTISAKAMRDFAIVLSDKFNVKEQTLNGTKILYYYYGDKEPDKSLLACVDSLNTFNSMIGKYEYPTLSICETNFVYGGMEYPSLVMISDNLETHEDYVYTIIHEIGHQWFYAMVGNNEFNHGWLDEGLTEYITACFYEQNPSYNKVYKDIINNAEKSYMLFVEVYGTVLGEIDTSMNRKLNEYKTDPEYTYLTYVKGMIMFANLRSVVGQDKFFKALQTYFEEYKGKNATPENLITTFEKTCHAKLSGFFDSYLEGKVKVVELSQ